MWDWIWLDGDSSDDSTNTSDVEDNADKSDDCDDNDTTGTAGISVSAITHSVIFKCIDVLKEDRYQEVLALANKSRNEGVDVPVKLEKEPDNPADARAIAFMCHADNAWERIGYIVKEALDDVHQAIDEQKILSVKFDWVKFMKLHKKAGWYTGINITRNGEWSQSVMHSRSTIFQVVN